MVFTAYLDTNVGSIIQDPVDSIHNIRYRGALIELNDTFSGVHVLNCSTGELRLDNIQCPERPVVLALASHHRFEDDKFTPLDTPSKGELYFPTIFELERLTRETIVINGIVRLCNDGIDCSPEHSFFEEQRAMLKAFVVAYDRAVASSYFGKPVLEGFYRIIKRRSSWFLKEAENPEGSEARRNAMRSLAYQEEDFLNIFGRTLLDKLGWK